MPEPMSGSTGFGAGQTWVSDNSDRPPLIEGMLIKGSTDNIYVVDNGRKRLITSPAVYTSCGYNPGEVVGVSNTALNLLLNGTNVTGGPCPYTLVQAPGSPDIYVVEKGVKRHIGSPKRFDRLL